MPLNRAERDLNARIESEGLHLRFNLQLVAMAKSHAAKIPRVESDLDKVLNFPDAVRWELKEAEFPADEIEAELVSQRTYYEQKKARLEEVVSLIADEQAFRAAGKVTRVPTG